MSNSIITKFDLALAHKSNRPFLLQVDLKLPAQGITVIFGDSGSGKTTLLRCIAGLQTVKAGKVIVDGETWQDNDMCLPTHKRDLAYVFQEASLLPHLHGQGNLDFALKRSKKAINPDSINHVISLMGIENVLLKYPSQMSGGERQRVAITRALLIQPRLLLMDEPLASLDQARKLEIMPYLEKLRTEFQIPVIYVTHSMDELSRLANYLVLLEHGKVKAQGSLAELMSRLDLSLTAEMENAVVLDARVKQRDEQWQLMLVEFPGGELCLPDGGEQIGQSIRLRIVASDVSLALRDNQQTSILNRVHAEIIEIADAPNAAMLIVKLKVGDSLILASLTRRSFYHLELCKGGRVWAQIKSAAIVR